LASIGAWVGPEQVFLAFMFMGLAGGVMALIWAMRGKFVGESLDGTADLIFGFWKRGLRPHPSLALSNPKARTMPYAPAIAIGAILSFFAMS
jgi:prepilin peptidase CpaA